MSRKHNSTAREHFNSLTEFRQAAYQRLGRARDALFELSDAVLQMRVVQSFAELSCAPAFRRKWPSVYEALQDGQPPRGELMKLYLNYRPAEERVILAGDHTVWEHLWGETLAGRSYQHQPTAIPGRRPITLGHGYSTLALIPETQGSWALPLLHERILDQKAVVKGGEQLREVCRSLPVRPRSLWDSEYGCAAFLRATQGVPADLLFRLRGNLVLEGPSPPYGGRGARPKHGRKFKLRDPLTWWSSDLELDTLDPDFGSVHIQVWERLRFRQALDCWMSVARLERQQAPGTRRKPKVIWLGWVGQAPPSAWWKSYARRYALDHWYRLAKGRLHWTLPQLSTPVQGERWSDLMPLITWQLWLARPIVTDRPLPWQKALPQLSPGRVCQGMALILAEIGTPTCVPKPRGISPGWTPGRPRLPRPHFEVVRSAFWTQVRQRKKLKSLLSPA